VHRSTPASIQELLEGYGTPNEEILLMQIQTSLEKRFEFNQKMFMINELFEGLSSVIEYTPPKRVINRMMQEQAQSIAKNIMDSGGSKEDAEKQLEEVKQPLTDQCTRFMKRKAISTMLQRTLKATMNETDLQAHIADLAALYGKRPEELRKELIDSDKLSSVSAQVLDGKMFDQLEDQLKFTEVDARTIG
jgi:FKBP-type peptidyl-prolyl cis-trans isomerase (trigger factor)